MHLQDEILLARIDEELDPETDAGARRHLASCEACAGRMRDLRMNLRRIEVALSALDERSPLVEPPARPVRAAQTVPTSGRFQSRSLAIAASLVFLMAAGAWAIPGSPLRAWLNAALSSDDAVSQSAGAVPAEEVEGTTGREVDVSVEPRDGRVEIVLRHPAMDTRLRIVIAEGPRASVRAADAEYRVSPGSIELDRVRGLVDVSLPATASGRVRVDQTVVAEVREGRLRVMPEAAGSGVVVEAG